MSQPSTYQVGPDGGDRAFSRLGGKPTVKSGQVGVRLPVRRSHEGEEVALGIISLHARADAAAGFWRAPPAEPVEADVVLAAQPANVQRLRVVVVVGMGLRMAADFAGLTMHRPCCQRPLDSPVGPLVNGSGGGPPVPPRPAYAPPRAEPLKQYALLADARPEHPPALVAHDLHFPPSIAPHCVGEHRQRKRCWKMQPRPGILR